MRSLDYILPFAFIRKNRKCKLRNSSFFINWQIIPPVVATQFVIYQFAVNFYRLQILLQHESQHWVKQYLTSHPTELSNSSTSSSSSPVSAATDAAQYTLRVSASPPSCIVKLPSSCRIFHRNSRSLFLLEGMLLLMVVVAACLDIVQHKILACRPSTGRSPRNFQRSLWLLGTTISYDHCSPK